MHSRLFYLSETKEEEGFSLNSWEADMESYFVGHIADYVSCENSEEMKISIEWLFSHFQSLNNVIIDTNNYSITFKNGFREEYFKSNFEKLKEKVNNLTLTDFANSDMISYELRTLVESEFGFYICLTSNGYETLDSFVRWCKLDTPYYILGTMDYHY